MNRAARRHLLAVLERAASPLRIIYAASLDPPEETMLAALRELAWSNRIVLPAPSRIELVQPRTRVRVVAGKGKRRRGVAPARYVLEPGPIRARFWNWITERADRHGRDAGTHPPGAGPSTRSRTGAA